MSRLRRPHRLATAVAAVVAALALTVAASACSEVGGEALVVNGEATSYQEFQDELDAFADNEAFVAALEGGGVSVSGEGEGTLSSALVAQIATLRITSELISQEVDERDLEVTDADVAQGQQLAQQQLPGYADFPDEYRAQLDAWFGDRVALEAALAEEAGDEGVPEVTDEQVREQYDANPDAFEERCLRIIVADGEAAAQGAVDRIAGGEDFATVAAEVSQDPSSAQGGDISCISLAELPAELSDAIRDLPLDQTSGIIEVTSTQTPVFVVAEVYESTSTSFEEAEADIRAQLEAQAEAAAQQDGGPLNLFLGEALASAEVEVASRYGSWDEESLTVVPPEGPTITTLAPGTGAPVDPNTGQPVDPATGQPVDPATGQPVDPNTGQPVDPATGQPIDPATGQPVDPAAGG